MPLEQLDAGERLKPQRHAWLQGDDLVGSIGAFASDVYALYILLLTFVGLGYRDFQHPNHD
jgi:hypothetical protein